MERPTIKTDFGSQHFSVLDVWPSKEKPAVLANPAGVNDERVTYLSFKMTKAQRKVLGNTDATHFRVEVRQES